MDRDQSAIESGPERKLYQDWLSGKLDEAVDACTRAHGYGKLQSTGEICGVEGSVSREDNGDDILAAT